MEEVHLTDTVSVNKIHLTDRVPFNKMHLTGTLFSGSQVTMTLVDK